MKAAFLLVLFAAVAFATIGDECTPTSNSTVTAINFGDNTPVNVLYIVITNSGDPTWGYNPDMLTGYNLLVTAINQFNNASTTTFQWLYQGNPITYDITGYDQVWVVDLCASDDNEADKMAAYTLVSDWWVSKGQPHIITDGRWISSLWTYAGTIGGSTPIYGYPVNYGRPNYKLVRNYFENLRVRGGGLVLATDHATDFTRGINEINTNLGLNTFVGFFYEDPYLMETDQNSILLNWPEDPTHHWITDPNDTTKILKWLWDDSSTSYAPFNNQPNGIILYPLGWHKSSGSGNPGISSTIRGTQGFLVAIDSPTCDQKFLAADQVAFTSVITNAGNPPFSYQWTSDVDGALSTADSFTGTLSIGAHNIKLRVTDSQKFVAEARVRVRVSISSGTGSMCYLASYNGGPEVVEVFPIARSLAATAYFNNTYLPDNIVETGNSQWFFYNDGTGISIINALATNANGNSAHGNSKRSTDNSGSKIRVAISGLVGAQLSVPGVSTRDVVTFDSPSGTGRANLKFTRDGLVFTGLPTTGSYCASFVFDGRSNLDELVVRSHSQESATVPNSSPIVAYRVDDFSVKRLDLCFTQCRCAAQSYSSLTDSFTNSVVLDASTSNYGNYLPNQHCSWLIQPQSNAAVWGVTIYFQYFQLASGDSVSVYAGSDATAALVGTFTGTTNPGAVRVDASSAFVTFTSDDDGHTDIGFGATYYVIPQITAVTPNTGKSKGYTYTVVTGANFINNNQMLSCMFDTKAVPAHYLNSTAIECVSPMHNVGSFNVQASNDGRAFSAAGTGTLSAAVPFAWTGYTCPN